MAVQKVLYHLLLAGARPGETEIFLQACPDGIAHGGSPVLGWAPFPLAATVSMFLRWDNNIDKSIKSLP
jgi:hypothetical protein